MKKGKDRKAEEMRARILMYMVYKGIWAQKKSIALTHLTKGMAKEGFLNKPLTELRKKLENAHKLPIKLKN